MKKFIPLFALSALVCATSFAADDIDARLNKARQAAESFNAAIAAKNGAHEMITELSDACGASKSECQNIEARIEDFGKNLTRNNLVYAKYTADLELKKAALEDFRKRLENTKDLPKSLDKTVDATRALLSKNAEIVAQTPGENFQNKHEFESIKASFNAAVFALDEAKKRIAKDTASAPIASVMFSSAKTSLSMAADYLKKAESQSEADAKTLTKTKAAIDDVEKSTNALAADYLKLSATAAEARAKLLERFAILSAQAAIDGASEDGCSFALDYSADAISPIMGRNANAYDEGASALSLNRMQKAKSPNSGWVKAASAQYDTLATPERKRAMLGDFAKIERTARHIQTFANVLNALCTQYENARSDMENIASNAEALFGTAISLYSNSQLISGNLNALNIRTTQLAAKEALTKRETKNLMESAESKFALAVSKAE